MKILITSDNHLGFKETDPIRADDTFNTFDEILTIARNENVSCIIQGGDLFHENKPSRNTYNRTMQLLKKHCLGSTKPVFKTSIKINSDDPNMQVSLPLITIHGNHDDPSGFNSVSPHDILNSGGFINYIGKIKDVDNIEIDPLLIINNNIKIAIFGMGHIKDRRVYKTFMKGNVKYNRPEGEGWINIFVVHQNRAFRAGEYLPEDFIAPFFDIVVYGHEHESIKTSHSNFEVIQCGSTVRTSLCEGETGDKFVYILEVTEKVKISRIRLNTVREFVMDSIKINNITVDLINKKIEELVEKIKTKGSTMLPLLRLRIDVEGEANINKPKVMLYLEGKIANPNDSLRISRKIEKETIKQGKVIQRNTIEDIYQGILEECGLKALVQGRVIEALVDFVNKDIKESFSNLVKEGVNKIIENVNFDDLIADSIDEAIKNARERISKDFTYSQRKLVDNSSNRDNNFNNNLNNAIKDIKNDKDTSNFNNSIRDIRNNNNNDNNITNNFVSNNNISNYSIRDNINIKEISSIDYTLENKVEQQSVSFQNSSLINLKSINSKSDFTFIEDKIDDTKKREIIKEVHREIEEKVKKTKVEDDFDDLFGFSKFME